MSIWINSPFPIRYYLLVEILTALMLCMVGKNFRDILIYLFAKKKRLCHFMQIELSPKETISINCQTFFFQEGQLSISGERMCTILVNRIED